MKLTSKLLCLALALTLLFGAFSCAAGDQTGDEDTVGSSTKAPAATDAADTGERLDVEAKNWGITAKFMTRDAAEWSTVDIFAEKDSSDPIQAAVFRRNLDVEENYGIKVEEWKTPDTQGEVEKVVKSSSQDYAAVVGQLVDMAPLSANGRFYDLRSLPNIDLTKSWWDQKAVEGLSVANKVFYATGDLLTSDNDATFIIMFNKTILENSDLLGSTLSGVKGTNLYELVANKEWTLENMYRLAQAATKEMGGDSEKLSPYEDQVGFAMTGNVPFSLLYGGGVIVTKKNSDDIPEFQLSDATALSRADEVVSAAYRLYGDGKISFNMEQEHEGNGVQQNGKDCFGNGHALFFGECLQVVIRLRSHSINFGVIPYPLLDSSQDSYYSVMNNVGGVVAIPICLTEKNAENAAVALEVLAAKSQNTLTPAYYDTTLIAKGTKDTESKPMIDLILETRVYDLAYVYGWAGATTKLAALISKGGSVTTAVKRMQSSMNRHIKETLKGMNID